MRSEISSAPAKPSSDLRGRASISRSPVVKSALALATGWRRRRLVLPSSGFLISRQAMPESGNLITARQPKTEPGSGRGFRRSIPVRRQREPPVRAPTTSNFPARLVPLNSTIAAPICCCSGPVRITTFAGPPDRRSDQTRRAKGPAQPICRPIPLSSS